MAALKVGSLTVDQQIKSYEHNIKKDFKNQFLGNNLHLFFCFNTSEKTKCKPIY